jgi:hypothetical protein
MQAKVGTEAITAARLLPMVLAGVMGSALCVSGARADIYTWTDAGGRVNISNLEPPEGVRVTSVLRETPKPVATQQLSVASTPQPDVQALAERVRQLEWEAELAKRQPPPPTVIYVAAPPQQPVVQYPVQYPYVPEPAPAGYGYGYGYGCDPSRIGCGFSWPSFGYPVGVVVLTTPRLHRSGAFHGKHRAAFPQPIRSPSLRPPGPPPGRSFGGMHRR